VGTVESWASSPAIRKSMQANRPRDTLLEVAFRSALHQAGFRFRKHVRPLPGLRCEPDVIFPRFRLAIFVDGCWWHSCPEHGMLPREHGAWWAEKLQRTKDRDRRNDRALRSAGWTVLRVWEHESLQEAVYRVRSTLDQLRKREGARDGRNEVAAGVRSRSDVARGSLR
jgi:DNA mismatch endonuclease (patch repair protein)